MDPRPAPTPPAPPSASDLGPRRRRRRSRTARRLDPLDSQPDPGGDDRPGPREWALALPFVAGALVDLPRLWRVGPASGLGLLVVAGVALAIGLIAASGIPPRRLAQHLAPAAAFFVWATLTLTWAPGAPDAWPVWASYALLLTTAAAAASAAARRPAAVRAVLDRAANVYDAVGLTLGAVGIAEHGFDVMSWPVHPRAFAMAALASVGWRLAQWYDGRRWALVPVGLWAALAVASLSRMPSFVIACCALAAVSIHRRLRRDEAGGRRRRAALAASVLVAAAISTTVRPFRDRLFTEDRVEVLGRVVQSALRAPLLVQLAGQGLGSSITAPKLRYWYTPPPASEARAPAHLNYYWVQPNNEFLRAWHDAGVVGLVLFGTWVVGWLAVLGGRVRRAGRHPDARLAVAALLVLGGFLLQAQVEGPIAFPFVAGPVAVVVGAGLGDASRRRRRARAAVPNVPPEPA